VPVHNQLKLAAEINGVSTTERGCRFAMDPKSSRDLNVVAGRTGSSQLQPEIPITSVPEIWIDTTATKPGIATDDGAHRGNKVLNDEELRELIGIQPLSRCPQRTCPGSQATTMDIDDRTGRQM
jgi:hypothetical protein